MSAEPLVAADLAAEIFERLRKRAVETEKVLPMQFAPSHGRRKRAPLYVVADGMESRAVDAWLSIQKRFKPFLEDAIGSGRLVVRASDTLLPMAGSDALRDGNYLGRT